jgi:hypothetical protein
MTNIKLIETKEKDIVAKRNYVALFLPVVLLLILICSLYIYNTNTSKIKRYLTNKEYECNKVECTKVTDDYQYNIDVNNLDITISNDKHIIKIKSNEITLQQRADKRLCAYTSNQYSRTKQIDDTYSYSVYCQEYVSEINELILDYKTILEESKVKL